MLFVMANQAAILSQGVAGQSLFFVKLRKPVIDLDLTRIELLHLFVNSNSLQVKAIFRIIPGNRLILIEGMIRLPGATVQFGKFLPIANILGIDFHNFLKIFYGLGQLPLLEAFLGRGKEFGFIRHGYHLNRRNTSI